MSPEPWSIASGGPENDGQGGRGGRSGVLRTTIPTQPIVSGRRVAGRGSGDMPLWSRLKFVVGLAALRWVDRQADEGQRGFYLDRGEHGEGPPGRRRPRRTSGRDR